MGVRAWEKIDPCNVIVVAAFDSSKSKRHQMFVVQEPASPEEIEDLKDQRMVNEGSRCSGWHVVEWDNPKPNGGGGTGPRRMRLFGSGPIDHLDNIMHSSGKTTAEITWEPFEPLPDLPLKVPPSGPSSSTSTNIPQLITAHGIDASDCNVVLGSVYELPFPTAFKTLLGSTMALWAGSAPDPSTVEYHGLDQVINGFMDFVSPSHPTTISPVQLPVEIPPTPQYSDPLLPSPLPHAEDAVISDHMSSHICTLMPRPLEEGKMQAQELSKVPGDLMPVPITHSSLPAPFPAPIELVSPAIVSAAPQGTSAGYPP